MHENNLPVTPGAIIGYLSNGHPIRLIAGGSGEGEGDGGEGQGGTATATEGSTQPEPASTGTSGQEGSTGSGNGSSGSTASGGSQPASDDTPRVISALRNDFKGERAKRQQAEQEFAAFKADMERRDTERQAAETERSRKLAIALGVASEDEPPDPAKLAEQLERAGTEHAAALSAKDAEIRQRDIRLAVLTQSAGLGANGALLMDSVSFLRKLADLDPSAEGFAETLGEQIKAAAEANPQYKITPPKEPAARKEPNPARSGGEFNGSPGGNRQWTVEDVKRHSPEEVVAAQEAGLLIDLGYNPRKKR